MKKVIATAAAPQAVGPYSQAVEADGTVYVSGQLPIDPISGTMPGRPADRTIAAQHRGDPRRSRMLVRQRGQIDRFARRYQQFRGHERSLRSILHRADAGPGVLSGRGAAQRRKSRDRCDRRKIDAVRLSYRENDRTLLSGRFCRWESVAGRAAACGLIRSRGFSGFRSDRRTGSGRSLRRPIS